MICPPKRTTSLNVVHLVASGIVLTGQTVPTGTASSIVVNTHKGNAAGLNSSFATINKRMQGKIPTPLQVQTVSLNRAVLQFLY